MAGPRYTPTRLTRTFAALLGGQLGGRTIRLLYIVALARFIEPSELGLYLYGIGVYVVLLGFAGFGQGLFLAARVPYRRAIGAWFAHSLTIRLGATGIAGILGLIYIWAQESDSLVRVTVALFVCTLLVRSLAAWVREVHVALEDAAWIPRYETGFRGAEAIIGIALVSSGLGVVWLAGLHLAVWTIEAAMSVRLMVRRGRLPTSLGRSGRLLRPMILVSFWHMAGIGLLLAFGQIGVVGLRLLDATPAGVGQFAVAAQGLLALILVPGTLAAAMVPALSRVRRRSAGNDQRAVTMLVRWSLVAGTVLAILVEGYGASVVRFVLGPEYTDAAVLFSSLAWATGPYAAAIVSIQALNALGRKRRAALIAAIMVATHITLLVSLFSTQGASSACLALIAGALLGCAAGARFLGVAVQVRGFTWWVAPLFVTASAAALMRLVPVSAPQLALPVLALSVVAFAASRVITRGELAYIARRFTRGTGESRRGELSSTQRTCPPSASKHVLR